MSENEVLGAELAAPNIEALRAVAEAATPGPWLADVLGSEGYAVREAQGSPRHGSRIPRPVRVARCGYEDWDTDKANAQFIATFDPSTVLGLLDALDAAQAEAANLAHDYDRRGERLWRLAAEAGHMPHEADNDAVAELVVSQALTYRIPPASTEEADRG